MKTLLAVSAALLVAGAVRAEPTDPLERRGDNSSLVNAAGEAQSLRMPDCNENQALNALSLSVLVDDAGRKQTLDFKFDSCKTAERDDLEPGYETRGYSAPGGWSLVLVTYLEGGAYGQHSTTVSTVLLAKGSKWVARFGDVDNLALLSGFYGRVGMEELGSGTATLVAGRRGCSPRPALDSVVHAHVSTEGVDIVNGVFSPVTCSRVGALERRTYKGPGQDTMVIETRPGHLQVSFPFQSVSGEATDEGVEPGSGIQTTHVTAYTRGPRPRYILSLLFPR